MREAVRSASPGGRRLGAPRAISGRDSLVLGREFTQSAAVFLREDLYEARAILSPVFEYFTGACAPGAAGMLFYQLPQQRFICQPLVPQIPLYFCVLFTFR